MPHFVFALLFALAGPLFFVSPVDAETASAPNDCDCCEGDAHASSGFFEHCDADDCERGNECADCDCCAAQAGQVLAVIATLLSPSPPPADDVAFAAERDPPTALSQLIERPPRPSV